MACLCTVPLDSRAFADCMDEITRVHTVAIEKFNIITTYYFLFLDSGATSPHACTQCQTVAA